VNCRLAARGDFYKRKIPSAALYLSPKYAHTNAQTSNKQLIYTAKRYIITMKYIGGRNGTTEEA
jgi:hypothetical protein